jgi:hypothetical protein
VTRQRQCFPESCAAGATLASTQTPPNANAIQYLATRRADEQDIVVLLTKNEQAGQARAVDLFRPPNDSRFTDHGSRSCFISGCYASPARTFGVAPKRTLF